MMIGYNLNKQYMCAKQKPLQVLLSSETKVSEMASGDCLERFWIYWEPTKRVELLTDGLQNHCSTTELRRLVTGYV